uniref:Disease resistance protein RPS2 n=1 Tax=Cajanus cajan TaxID=3821 RepID=A0A151UD40_CAJCA|nr:hypothetical protein KK1_021420 [Cajanus cajan]
MPNLEKLSLWESVPSANIAPQERLGTVLQLKELVLSRSGINDIGLERLPFLRRLELLTLQRCHNLSILAPPSVIDCDQIKEIISNEGNEKENIEIVFSNLITIELVTLKQLTSFCSNKNYTFKFPLLKILIVRECCKMETFSKNPASAPKLQKNILAVEGEEEAKWQWESDLNGTIQKVFNDTRVFPISSRKARAFEKCNLPSQL